MKLRRVQVSVFDYLCLHKVLKILMHQHSLFYVFIIQQFFLAIFSRKKATPENLISRVAFKTHFNSFLKLTIDIETSKISIQRTKSTVILLYHFILLKSTPRIIALTTN